MAAYGSVRVPLRGAYGVGHVIMALKALPADSDICVQLGDEMLEVSGLTFPHGGDLVGITSLPADLRDVMKSWGVAKQVRQQIVDGPPLPQLGKPGTGG
jgi:hypothetical protein